MATILLVDDERIVRTLVRVALENRGYEVLEAGTGQRAIQLARKHHGPVDLLLAELSLPKMSGLDLAGALAPERPEMRMLFLSRAPQSEGLVEQARATGSAVMVEPFEMNKLERRIAEVCAAGRRKPVSAVRGAVPRKRHSRR